MDKLQWALAHVRAGWHVFPLPPNSKRPPRPDEPGEPRLGVRSASNSEEQVNTWWAQYPDANIAGTGFLVLDCDVKDGVDGLLNLDLHCHEHGVELPPTLEFRSQGGGTHLIYRADDAQPYGQGGVCEGVDVRAPFMGYICLPGSTIEGRAYTVQAKRAIAAAPAEIQASSAVGKRMREGEVEIEGEVDHPLSIMRAKALLESVGDLAAEHVTAYNIACRLLDWGLAPETVKELGLDHCARHWQGEWLVQVDNAVRYRQNNIGGQGTAGGAPSAKLLEIRQRALAKLKEDAAGLGVKASSIEAREVVLLWPPYVMRGGVTILGGRGGVGKGLVSAQAAACVSAGRPWPASAVTPEPALVAWGETEDPIREVLIPRLTAAGCNLDNVEILDNKQLTQEKLFLYLLERRPALLVLSPLLSFMKGLRDINSEIEVREALVVFNEVITDTQTAVLGIGHLSKKADLDAIDRLLGSVAFVNFVRNVALVGPDPEAEEQMRLVHGKHNVSKRGDDLIYRIVPPEPGQHSQAVTVAWERAAENVDPRDMYKRKTDKETAVSRAERWLFEYLQGGPMERKHVLVAAKAEGINATALDRALGTSSRIFSRWTHEQPPRAFWYVAGCEPEEPSRAHA